MRESASQRPTRRTSVGWLLVPLIAAAAWGIGVLAGRFGDFDREVPPLPAPPPAYLPPATFAALRTESFEVIDQLLARAPNDAAACEKAAQLAGVFGEKELAARYWQRCVELAPHFMQARYFLAWSALQDGRFNDMAEHASAALGQTASDSQDAVVFRDLLGFALIELGELLDAKKVLRENVQRGAATCDTFTLLGKASLLQREFAEAAGYYREAIDIDPQWSKALYGLATASARQGDKQTAQEMFERFRRLQVTERPKTSEQQLAAAQHDVAMIYRNAASIYDQYGDAFNAQRLSHWSEQLAATSNITLGARQEPSRRISDK